MKSVSNGDTGENPVQISWKVHPFTENGAKSALLVVIILAVCFGVFTWMPYVSAVLLALAFLVVSMAPFLFPTFYRADNNGLEIRFIGIKTFRSWDEFRNYYPHDVGVHLSTFRKPGLLDAFRGSFIRFEPGRREEILDFIGSHVRKPDPGQREEEKVDVNSDRGSESGK